MVDAIWRVLEESWLVLLDMAPYLLLGFLVAGVLSVLVSPAWIERHLGGRGFWPVFKSALFGVPLPLCSCGVIPVSAGLRRHGASRGAVASFLLSTPQTGVDSIAVTAALLGPVFAVLRPVVAFITGIVGGLLVDLLDPDKRLPVDAMLQRGEAELGRSSCDDTACASSCGSSCGTSATAASDSACCSSSCLPGEHPHGFWPRVRQALHYGLVTLPEDLVRALAVGILIAGIISALLPQGAIGDFVGTGPASLLLMMLFGLPLYVCATASVPIAAMLWLHQGVPPGAVLVFLITGPATNAATISVIWKTLGRRTAFVYLGTVVVSALAAGLLLNHLLTATPELEHMHEHAGPVWLWFQRICAVFLVGVMANAVVQRRSASATAIKTTPTTEPVRQTVRLKIRGMRCNRCAETIARNLAELPGVVDARVDLEEHRALVEGHDLNCESLVATVTELGYGATCE